MSLGFRVYGFRFMGLGFRVYGFMGLGFRVVGGYPATVLSKKTLQKRTLIFWKLA